MRRTLFAGRATCALHGLYCAAQRPHGHRKRGGAGHALLRACALTRAHTPQGLPVLLFTSSQASERASKRKTCICLNPGGDGGTEGRREEERDRERGRETGRESGGGGESERVRGRVLSCFAKQWGADASAAAQAPANGYAALASVPSCRFPRAVEAAFLVNLQTSQANKLKLA